MKKAFKIKVSVFTNSDKRQVTRVVNSAVGGKVKKISREAAREKAIDSIIASLRIEQLTPSATVVQGLRACVAGTETTSHVLAGVIHQHVTVRRD
jgi:hypothetical protein